MPQGNLIAFQPHTPSTPASLVLYTAGGLINYELTPESPVSLMKQSSERWCTGWYDISAHECHACPQQRKVDTKLTTCFDCRQRTGFNPAFYNSEQISPVQATYNKQPHSVYIAYFGHGLAKAGIMSDSRGLLRLYEQGALMYVHMGSFPDAYLAHDLETQLISQGLKNSVAKKQKAAVWQTSLDVREEKSHFERILHGLGVPASNITSNIEHFFFGTYPQQPIHPLPETSAPSGKVSGIVGQYLILNNEHRLYGFWLTELLGFQISVTQDYSPISASPEQASLF